MAQRTRIVVLGAGFGGVTTIRHLLRSTFVREHCEIVVVDQSPNHVFTPWLYEVASGDIAAHAYTDQAVHTSAAIPLERLWERERRSVHVRHAKVVGCDVEHRHVLLEGGHTLAFDVLLVALGSQTAFFGIPGLQEYAYTFKSLHDANAINGHVRRMVHEIAHGKRTGVHVVIGGAGPSGVELAAELRTMLRRVQSLRNVPADAVRITIVTAGTRVLDMAPARVSHVAARRLKMLGVEVMCNTVITRAEEGGITVQPRPRQAHEIGSSLSQDARPTDIVCDMIVWCGGVGPTDVVRAFALPKDAKGRIQIGTTFEVVGHVNIFAVGDNACMVGLAAPLPATAHAAEVSSKHAAENIVRAIQRRALRGFRAGRWPMIVMLGGKWGVALLGGLVMTGLPVYWLRRMVDLAYLLRLMPWVDAVYLWRDRVKMYANND